MASGLCARALVHLQQIVDSPLVVLESNEYTQSLPKGWVAIQSHGVLFMHRIADNQPLMSINM